MPESSPHGGFLNGFSLGLLAGAAGFVLFGTKRGEQIRHQLRGEWKQAVQELGAEALQAPPATLRDFLHQSFDTFQRELQAAPTPAKRVPSRQSALPKSKKAPKPPITKFKNVK